jgi:hypothetical protein
MSGQVTFSSGIAPILTAAPIRPDRTKGKKDKRSSHRIAMNSSVKADLELSQCHPVAHWYSSCVGMARGQTSAPIEGTIKKLGATVPGLRMIH